MIGGDGREHVSETRSAKVAGSTEQGARDAAATNGLGRHYLGVSRLAEALNVYEAAVETDPNNDGAIKRVAA